MKVADATQNLSIINTLAAIHDVERSRLVDQQLIEDIFRPQTAEHIC